MSTWRCGRWFRGINSVLGVERTGIYGHARRGVGDRRRRSPAPTAAGTGGHGRRRHGPTGSAAPRGGLPVGGLTPPRTLVSFGAVPTWTWTTSSPTDFGSGSSTGLIDAFRLGMAEFDDCSSLIADLRDQRVRSQSEIFLHSGFPGPLLQNRDGPGLEELDLNDLAAHSGLALRGGGVGNRRRLLLCRLPGLRKAAEHSRAPDPPNRHPGALRIGHRARRRTSASKGVGSRLEQHRRRVRRTSQAARTGSETKCRDECRNRLLLSGEDAAATRNVRAWRRDEYEDQSGHQDLYRPAPTAIGRPCWVIICARERNLRTCWYRWGVSSVVDSYRGEGQLMRSEIIDRCCSGVDRVRAVVATGAIGHAAAGGALLRPWRNWRLGRLHAHAGPDHARRTEHHAPARGAGSATARTLETFSAEKDRQTDNRSDGDGSPVCQFCIDSNR